MAECRWLCPRLLTEISQTGIEVKVNIKTYIRVKLEDVSTHPCPNIKNGLVKLSLELVKLPLEGMHGYYISNWRSREGTAPQPVMKKRDCNYLYVATIHTRR